MKSNKQPTPATEAALATPVVLQNILLRLPMRDLLRVQRVSKGFKAAIERSAPIQRKLFLSPAPTHDSKGNQIAPQINPLFYGTKSMALAIRSRKVNEDNGGTDYVLVVHGDATDNRPASWEKMFVAQPPGSLSSLSVWFPELVKKLAKEEDKKKGSKSDEGYWKRVIDARARLCAVAMDPERRGASSKRLHFRAEAPDCVVNMGQIVDSSVVEQYEDKR